MGNWIPSSGNSASVFPTPGSSFTVLGNLRTDIELLITDLRPDDVR